MPINDYFLEMGLIRPLSLDPTVLLGISLFELDDERCRRFHRSGFALSLWRFVVHYPRLKTFIRDDIPIIKDLQDFLKFKLESGTSRYISQGITFGMLVLRVQLLNGK